MSKINRIFKDMGSSLEPEKKWVDDTRSFLLSEFAETRQGSFAFAHRLIEKSVQWKLAFKPAAAFAMVMLLFVVSSFATVNASQNTLPGNPLYNIKIGAEKLKYVLAFSEESRTRMVIEIAGRRADEFTKLAINSESGGAGQMTAQHVSVQVKDQLGSLKSRLNDLKKEGDVSSVVAAVKEIDAGVNDIKNKLKNASIEGELASSAASLLQETEDIKLVALTVLVERHESGQVDLTEEGLGKQVEEQIAKMAVDIEGLRNGVAAEAATRVEEAETLLENDDLSGAIEKIMDTQDLIKDSKVPVVEGVTDEAIIDVVEDVPTSTPTTTKPAVNPYFDDEPWLLDSEKEEAEIEQIFEGLK